MVEPIRIGVDNLIPRLLKELDVAAEFPEVRRDTFKNNKKKPAKDLIANTRDSYQVYLDALADPQLDNTEYYKAFEKVLDKLNNALSMKYVNGNGGKVNTKHQYQHRIREMKPRLRHELPEVILPKRPESTYPKSKNVDLIYLVYEL